MLYISLSIIFNVLLLVILKSFSRFQVPVFQAIVVNYFVAGSLSLLNSPSVDSVGADSWLPFAVLQGCLFISVFYLISRTAERMNMAVASVANKMSVVIPVLFSVLFYHESLAGYKMIGLLIALAAVVLTVKQKNTVSDSTAINVVFLPALVFIGSGIIDSLVTFAQKENFPTEKFIGYSFLFSGCVGSVILLIRYFTAKAKFSVRSFAGGVVLGIPNFYSIFFIMKALGQDNWESSQVYPLVNTGVMLGSTLCGKIFFRETLSFINYAGISLSLLAIALLAGWV